jgi:hypothetical protein
MSAILQKIEYVGGPLCGVVQNVEMSEPPEQIVSVIYYGGTAKYKLREDDSAKADYVEG